MRAGPLEIRQLYHLHGQDSEPRRDVEQMVAVIGSDRACSGTIQPGFCTGLREYPVCHLCHKKRSEIERHHRFGRCLWTIACTHALAGEPTPPTWKNRGHRGIERTNAAAGGQWGKKVRTAFEPAGPSSLIAALLLPLPSTVPGLTRTRMQKWTIVDIKPLLPTHGLKCGFASL